MPCETASNVRSIVKNFEGVGFWVSGKVSQMKPFGMGDGP